MHLATRWRRIQIGISGSTKEYLFVFPNTAEHNWRKYKRCQVVSLSNPDHKPQGVRSGPNAAKQSYYASLVHAFLHYPRWEFNMLSSLLRPPFLLWSSLFIHYLNSYFGEKIEAIREFQKSPTTTSTYLLTFGSLYSLFPLVSMNELPRLLAKANGALALQPSRPFKDFASLMLKRELKNN